MGTVKLENLLSDKALLVATCEVLARHMNGPAMRRLRFLLEELALDASAAPLYPEDREWLHAGIDKAAERLGHWQAELARLCNVGVDLIACIDDTYPLNLSLVHDGPPLLFVRGELTSGDRRAVAIVGTRSASKSGLDLAERLASGVVERDYTVIAGLAAGIDTAAHAAAVNVGGRTIAVFGTDIERTYPAANRSLANAICQQGACVSQFLPGTASGPWSFPARNLTTSGLSMATVVVEASETSGARRQAQAALEHGKPVFLVRSLVTSQPWAEEMSESQGDVTVVNEADEVVERLEEHLANVANAPFAFA